ncbi:MAG TPA: hypothetical protein VFT29_17090 [Gemmatimonadaceae bacterium]|nr:hypothetical protein [Gemmatimonadaceae bacterium]
MTMRIQITKRTDGGAVLKCVRDDGTETWQKQQGHQAAFFPLHDLTHFAVETELGINAGFYGLIASGWSIDETGARGVAARLPAEAIFVENVVGTLDSERASGSRWTADEFNESTARFAANGGRPAPRQLSDDELSRIRKRRAELFARWAALDPGGTLELTF